MEKSELDAMRHWYDAMSAKFDALAAKFDALSQSYITRLEFNPWQSATDKRLETLEDDLKEHRQWSNDEHSRLAEQVRESEVSIIKEINESNKTSWAMRITVAMSVIGWLVSIILYIVGFIIHR